MRVFVVDADVVMEDAPSNTDAIGSLERALERIACTALLEEPTKVPVACTVVLLDETVIRSTVTAVATDTSPDAPGTPKAKLNGPIVTVVSHPVFFGTKESPS